MATNLQLFPEFRDACERPSVVDFGALRADLRAHAHAQAEQMQLDRACTITLRVIQSFWYRIAPEDIPLRSPPVRPYVLPPALEQAARRFGEATANLPIAVAAYQLSLVYTSLLPADWRASRGVYFTPPALAERLLDQAEINGLDWRRAQVLDPAAGAGAFLVPAAVRMLQVLTDCSPAMVLQNISARIHGYELDPFSGWLTQVFLEAAALPHMVASGRRLDACIETRDSLAEAPSRMFDLVVGNPPFGRVSLRTDQRARFQRSLFGHANLYGMFLDIAVQLAKPGGLISFLTPASFLAGEYFKNLRALLWHEAPPVALDFVSVRKGVFENVLQETVLATYRKGARRTPASVSFVSPAPGQPVKVEAAGQCSLPNHALAPWLLPRHLDAAPLAERLRAMPTRIRDWGYKVSTGPLVWNRYKPQLCDRAQEGAVPLLWAECVTSDGRFVFRSQKRNHQPYFRVEPGDEWMLVHRACVLLQRTTAKEQARRLIAAEMPPSFLEKHSGITVENHLNMLIPLGDTPDVSPELLTAFLNTSAADRAFRCISGSVAVSAYEIENMPLPDVADMKQALQGRTDSASVESVATILYRPDGRA